MDLEGIMLSEINYDIFHMCNLKMPTQDFPGGPVVNTPKSGLLPGQRAMIPHATCHSQINKNTKLFFFFLKSRMMIAKGWWVGEFGRCC